MSVLKVAKREFRRIAERKTIYILSIILPLILFFFISYLYKNEVVREIPVAIYDGDRSVISRTLISFVESSSSMKIIAYVNSIGELKDLFQEGKIQGAFYIPSGMEIEVKKGKSSTINVYQNGTNLIVNNYILNDATKIIKTVSGGILLKKMKSKSMNQEQAMGIINPIRFDTQVLYNPNYSYESYLVPGLLLALMQMIVMVVAILLFSSEFSHKTFHHLLEVSNYSIISMILGKALPHLIIHSISILILFGLVFNMYNVEFAGSILISVLFTNYFVLVSFFMGLAISSLIHNQQTATEVALFINNPAFIFSGYTFPLWGMPFIHNIFAQIIPYTHFLTGFIKTFYMDAPLHSIYGEIGSLSIFLFVSIIIIWMSIRKEIRRIKVAKA